MLTFKVNGKMSTNMSNNDSLFLEPTGDLVAWNRSEAYNLISIDVFLILYTLIGVFGNTAVIYIYSFKLKVKFDDKFFILVLAGMDIVVCSTGPVFSLARNVLPVNFQGDVFCRICWYFVRTMGTASGMLLFVIAVQRYLKVCRPFGRQLTPFLNKVALSVTFGVAIVIDIPIFVFYGETRIHNSALNVTGHRCGRKDGESPSLDQAILIYFYFMFGCALSVMLGVTILYSLTGVTIYKQVKKHKDLTSDTYNSSTYSTNKSNSVKSTNECVSIQEISLTDSPEVSKKGSYKPFKNQYSVEKSPASKKGLKVALRSYVKDVCLESEESSSSQTTGSVESSSKTSKSETISSDDRDYSTDDVMTDEDCNNHQPPETQSSPGLQRDTCNGIKGNQNPKNSSKTVSFHQKVKSDHPDEVKTGTDSPKLKKDLSTKESNASVLKSKMNKQSSNVGIRWKKNRLMVHRFSIMFMMIAIVCTITYTPALIVNVMINMDSTEFWTVFENWERALYMFLFQMYLLNHVANPFIYAFFDTTFRNEFKNMLRCRKTEKPKKTPI